MTTGSGDDALTRLLAGNERFATGRPEGPGRTPARRAEVIEGQQPYAVVLTCSDSRVPPEIIFDAGIGDIFVVRTAGNVVDDVAVGSIDYAVHHLGTPLVIVLGHTSCGAVDAALSGGPFQGCIGSVVEAISPAVDEARTQPGDLYANVVEANVRRMVDLLKGGPILETRIAGDDLLVVGALYDLGTGRVSVL